MTVICSPTYRKTLETRVPMSAYPKNGGYHTFTAEGAMHKANAKFQGFLKEMEATREGFELLSTNVVPFFNGVGIYATYKFERTLTYAEIHERADTRRK